MQASPVRNSGPIPEGLLRITPFVVHNHGRVCCLTALAWLSALKCATPLSTARAVARRFEWGSIGTRDVFWCEVVAAGSLPCGAQAAIVQAIYGAESQRVQLIMRQPDREPHWRVKWTNSSSSAPPAENWLWDGWAYHEAAAVRRGSQLILADGMEELALGTSVGTIAAVRLPDARKGCQSMSFEDASTILLKGNEWSFT